jgi:hypothetical protein
MKYPDYLLLICPDDVANPGGRDANASGPFLGKTMKWGVGRQGLGVLRHCRIYHDIDIDAARDLERRLSSRYLI